MNNCKHEVVAPEYIANCPPKKPPHGCPPPPPIGFPPEYPYDYPWCYPVEPDVAPIPPELCRPCPPRPPYPPCPPCPPFPYPKPLVIKVDEVSKKIEKLSKKSQTLVQMINDFEKFGKNAILTINGRSYNFGGEKHINEAKEEEKGLYADIICGSESDIKFTSLEQFKAVDLLRSELKRVQLQLKKASDELSNEVAEHTLGEATGLLGVD